MGVSHEREEGLTGLWAPRRVVQQHRCYRREDLSITVQCSLHYSVHYITVSITLQCPLHYSVQRLKQRGSSRG